MSPKRVEVLTPARKAMHQRVAREWRQRRREEGRCYGCGAYVEKFSRCLACRVREQEKRSE